MGAGLAYVGARRGSRPEELAVRESRRDEWGRRFSEAIELMTDDSAQRRAMGRTLAGALLGSDLAEPDDLRIARVLLRATALPVRPGTTKGLASSAAPAAPVTLEQVESARLLVTLSGGTEGLDPEIVRIAGLAS